MLEYLAASGQYVAILILCVSCWAAGLSVRKAPQEQAGALACDPLDPALRTSLDSRLAASSSPVTGGPDRSGEISRNARMVHDLIRSGDLSQDGVLESLVAMAEEHEATIASPARRAAPPLGRFGSDFGAPQPLSQPTPSHRPDRALAWHSATSNPARCDSPRILKRCEQEHEPLPARLADPITPEVLNRYRMYAKECAPIERPTNVPGLQS